VEGHPEQAALVEGVGAADAEGDQPAADVQEDGLAPAGGVDRPQDAVLVDDEQPGIAGRRHAHQRCGQAVGHGLQPELDAALLLDGGKHRVIQRMGDSLRRKAENQ
jgi:hypothetical protein